MSGPLTSRLALAKNFTTSGFSAGYCSPKLTAPPRAIPNLKVFGPDGNQPDEDRPAAATASRAMGNMGKDMGKSDLRLKK